MKKGILYTIIFTLIISFVFVFLLALVNELTKERTKKNEERALIKAVLKSFQIPFSGDDDAYTIFKEKIKIITRADTELYSYKHQDSTEYAILFRGMALWGQVVGILAVNEDVTIITGIEFISHNETPGLGGRIDEDAYKNQLRGEFLNSGKMITGTRIGTYDYNHQNSKIDGISGATRTSEQIEAIINQELTRLQKILGAVL